MGFNGHPGDKTDTALKLLFCLGLNFMAFLTNYKLFFSMKKLGDISSSEDENFPTSTKK